MWKKTSPSPECAFWSLTTTQLIGRWLGRCLKRRGVEVWDAGDGRSGAELAQQQAFDVILLDLNMPGLSGVETLELLRSHPGPNQHIPIVAFTADADLNRLESDHAFNGVVRKPIAVMELIEAIYILTEGQERARDSTEKSVSF